MSAETAASLVLFVNYDDMRGARLRECMTHARTYTDTFACTGALNYLYNAPQFV